MSMPNLSPEFEDQMRKAMDVPEPDTKRMNALRERFIVEGYTALKTKRRNITGSQPIHPGKSRIFSRRPAWQWAALGLVALVVAILASPGAVKALRPLLGYIPGLGVVEQSPSTLVLAEPVLIEREGFTLTIDQAISMTEKTVISYHYTEPAVNGDSSQPHEGEPFIPPVLRLPDGSSLGLTQMGGMYQDEEDLVTVMWFPPLPAGIDSVTLELSRLNGMEPGMSPEDWDIPIRFKPGDLSEITLPVVEYEIAAGLPPATGQEDQPAPTTETQAQPAQSAVNDGITLSLEKAVEVPDGYILMGSLKWTDASISPNNMWLAEPPVVKDANGQDVPFEWAQPEAGAQPDELRHTWAYKITTKDLAAPLSLAFKVLLWEPADAAFQFDPGPNPQHGQIWDLNLDVPVKDHTVKVISAKYFNPKANIRAFEFTMTSDPDVSGAGLVNLSQPPSMGGGGDGNWLPEDGIFFGGFNLDSETPAGPWSIAIQSLRVLVPGNWTITWTP